MRSLKMRDHFYDRSFSVRFFDILVRSMVTMADAAASLVARLGYSEIGPLAIAVGPPIVVGRDAASRHAGISSLEPARPARRPGRLLTLDMGSELAGVRQGISGRSAA